MSGSATAKKAPNQPLDRIIKMIGMLGSDNDGEIIAAAKAIRRVLEENGQTFADLKIDLSTRSTKVVTKTVVVQREPTHVNLQPARELRDHYCDDLAPHEAKFIREMTVRIENNPYFKMTPKQESWFWFIYNKHAG